MSAEAGLVADSGGELRRRIVDLLANEPRTHRSVVTELVRRQYPLAALDQVESFVSGFSVEGSSFGAIDAMLADPKIDEILINGPGLVWTDSCGRLRPSDVSLSKYDLELLIERLLARSNLRASRSAPIVDAMLPDGSRVNVVLPPLAVDGPTVCIRKFGAEPLPIHAFGPPELASLMIQLISSGQTFLVVGATSSGKTSLLNALSRLIPSNERVVCIEDRAELQLVGEHVVNLEARQKNSEGVGEVNLRDLIKASLRMRPDRIIVGEVRGAEALDLLLAMTTGHGGSMSTCHASTAKGGLRRLATLAGLAEAATSIAVIERTVFEAVDVVVVVKRQGTVRFVAGVYGVPAEPIPNGDRLPILWSASKPPRVSNSEAGS